MLTFVTYDIAIECPCQRHVSQMLTLIEKMDEND